MIKNIFKMKKSSAEPDTKNVVGHVPYQNENNLISCADIGICSDAARYMNLDLFSEDSLKICKDKKLSVDNGGDRDSEIDAAMQAQSAFAISRFNMLMHVIDVGIRAVWQGEKKRIEERTELAKKKIETSRKRWYEFAKEYYSSFPEMLEQLKNDMIQPFFSKKKRGFFESEGFKVFFVIGLALLDVLFLYLLFETIFTQRPVYSYVTSFGFSLILNVIPIYLATFTMMAIYKVRKDAIYCVIGLALTYMMIFAPLSIVKVKYADSVIPKQNSNQIVINGNSTESQAESDRKESSKQTSVVILLVFEPLATSACAFFIGLKNSNVIENALEEAFVECEDAEKELSSLNCEAETLTNSVEKEEARLRLDLETKIAEYEHHTLILKIMFRSILGEHLGDPESAKILEAESAQLKDKFKARAPKDVIALSPVSDYHNLKTEYLNLEKDYAAKDSVA